MAKIPNYYFPTNTTTSIDLASWPKMLVTNPNAWINKHKEGLLGGWAVEYGNPTNPNGIRFQKEEDVMFFKLSTQ